MNEKENALAAKRQDSVLTAKDFLAAYAFMAWELEQRKEVNNG